MRRLFLAMLPLLLAGGCGGPEKRDADNRQAADSGAMLRYVAGGMYQSLAARSCSGAQSGALRAVQREETAFVAALESTLVEPAASHVALAKEDVQQMIKANALPCWSEDGDAFAALHRDIFFSSVETFRDVLHRPEYRPLPLRGLDWRVLSRAAEFRWRTRSVLESINWECTDIDRRPFLAIAEPRVNQFAQRMRRTKFAGQFELARADVWMANMLLFPNCSQMPIRPMSMVARNAALSALSRRIAAAERLASL